MIITNCKIPLQGQGVETKSEEKIVKMGSFCGITKIRT